LLPQDATRENAEQLLQAFVPRMGQHYALERNYDRGPGEHDNVSQLSPYIRRRLLKETEIISAALAAHGPKQAEKFIQEIVWRSYFKGWLERRPQIWTSYTEGLGADLLNVKRDAELCQSLAAAEAGTTGLDCFDAWARELTQTGYLHNHARMWFASIWIFTLGLPWRLGADFFYRHLLDGDPASNTCSWRWVAGLHTRGRPYVAQADNIAKFTAGRFTPHRNSFLTTTNGLQDHEPEGLPELLPLRAFTPPKAAVPTALLITEDDCCLEDFNPGAYDIRTVATLATSHLRSPRGTAQPVADFEATALADAAKRLHFDASALHAGVPEDLAVWAEAAGAEQIAMPYVPKGPFADWLATARPALQERGITLTEWRREWDGLVWPHATAGFFKVKKRLNDILQLADLT